MRLKYAVALTLLSVAPAMAQEKAAAPSLPAGWSMRLDRENVPTQPKFVTMGDGFHVTSGPAAIYYNPAHVVSGDYRVSATFTQTKAPTHPEAYGLFVGGSNLDKPEQEYGYIVIRGDGKYMIKHRAGAEVHTIQEWTEHPKLNKQDAEGKATNTVTIEAAGNKVRMLVNGEEVKSWERSYWKADGQLGLRINHQLDVHVSNFKVEKIAAK
jgi:hypothetical protein